MRVSFSFSFVQSGGFHWNYRTKKTAIDEERKDEIRNEFYQINSQQNSNEHVIVIYFTVWRQAIVCAGDTSAMAEPDFIWGGTFERYQICLS